MSTTAPAPASPGIAYNGRSLALGITGSGKSELLNLQFSAFRCQRALYDSKDEFTIPGVDRITGDVDALDWRQPVVHFVPGEDNRDDAQRFFAAAFARPGALVVCAHELGDLCDYNANAAPPAVKRYFVQGRALGKGILGGSQRPVGMPKQALTEAGDIFLFVPRLANADLETIAKELGLGADELAGHIDRTLERFGEHSFIRWNRRARSLVACPPLPDHERRRTSVWRRHDA